MANKSACNGNQQAGGYNISPPLPRQFQHTINERSNAIDCSPQRFHQTERKWRTRRIAINERSNAIDWMRTKDAARQKTILTYSDSGAMKRSGSGERSRSGSVPQTKATIIANLLNLNANLWKFFCCSQGVHLCSFVICVRSLGAWCEIWKGDMQRILIVVQTE